MLTLQRTSGALLNLHDMLISSLQTHHAELLMGMRIGLFRSDSLPAKTAAPSLLPLQIPYALLTTFAA